MKKLSKLLFIIGLFIFIPKVHAATGSLYVGTDTRQLNVPIVATFYTNSGSGFYEGITSNFDEYNGYFATSDTVTLDGYGEMICFDNPSAFNTNNIYSITLYLGKTGGTYGFKTNVKNERVSIGSSLGSAVGNWNSGAYYADLHYSNYRGTMFEVYDSNYHVIGKASYLTFIFTATGTGTAFCAPFNSAGETNTGYTLFFGYHYDILGTADGLTSSDIQNIISDSGLATASSISQVQQSVNNVKSEIQVMQETQAETNEKLDEQIQQDKEQHEETMNTIIGESEDTESSSCGIICKLKGIFTGIIELPGKLVNLLVDALKSLFIPTEEQIQEIIDDSQTMAENFGFVGEIVAFLVDTFTTLLNISQENGCISFPEFTLDFSLTPIGKTITFWNGTDVCMSDNPWFGTDSVGIVTLRLISTLTLVILFVNFCYREYWKIMSKESD